MAQIRDVPPRWKIRASGDLFVHLPPGYEESDQRYPTAYLLQAFGTTAAEMVTTATDGERWRPPPEDVLEPVFRRLGVPPMIVMIPDGWSRWGRGQWVDSPATGNFEQYLLHDVVTTVDATFRTIPGPESRAVFGFSSGGFGAATSRGSPLRRTRPRSPCDVMERSNPQAARDIIGDACKDPAERIQPRPAQHPLPNRPARVADEPDVATTTKEPCLRDF